MPIVFTRRAEDTLQKNNYDPLFSRGHVQLIDRVLAALK